MDKLTQNAAQVEPESDKLFVKMALNAWQIQIKRANAAFDGLAEDRLLEEIAPGKNRVIYLLGHLMVVHDALLPLLGLGEKLYPELEKTFLTEPDKAIATLPSAAELRASWARVNAELARHFQVMSPQAWLQRHTAVSEEDFLKDPSRNRLNVLLSRTSHVAYHLGQLALVKN